MSKFLKDLVVVGFCDNAKKLAQELQIENITDSSLAKEYYLFFQDGLLCLDKKNSQYSRLKPLMHPVLSKEFCRRLEQANRFQDPLKKALGKDKAQKILDLSFGWGKDNLMLLAWGYEVEAVERSALLYAFWQNLYDYFYAFNFNNQEKQRFNKSEEIKDINEGQKSYNKKNNNISTIREVYKKDFPEKLQETFLNTKVHQIEAYDFLKDTNVFNCKEYNKKNNINNNTNINTSVNNFNIIYYDPMYEERTSSSKKELFYLQELIGFDSDSEITAKYLFRHASARLVFKRAKKAKYLADKKPNFSVFAKSHRFDVYLNY